MTSACDDLPFRLRPYRGDDFDRLHRPGCKVLSSSNVPALLNVHPWQSEFSLAAYIVGKTQRKDEDNVMLRRGQLLQPVIAQMVAEKTGAEVVPLEHWTAHQEHADQISSPDALVVINGEPVPAEFKVVAQPVFHQAWTDDEAAIYPSVQHQDQLRITGAARGVIAALVVGSYSFDLRIYETERHDGVVRTLEARATPWLADVLNGWLPDPDDTAASDAALRQVYGESVEGSIISLDEDEDADRLARWEQATADRIAAEKIEAAQERYFRRRLLDAEAAEMPDGRLLMYKTAVRKQKALPARQTIYRRFRIKRVKT